MLGRTPHTPRRDADPGRLSRGRPDQGRLDQGRLDQGRLDQGRLDQGRLDQGRLDQGRLDQGQLDQGRLDPVRWRPPGRGTLIRLVAVAVLLGTAALAVWDRPPACRPERAASSPSCRSASAPAPAHPVADEVGHRTASPPAPGTNDAPVTSTAGTGAPNPDATGPAGTGTAGTGPAGTGTAGARTDEAGTDEAGAEQAGNGPPRWAVPPGTVGVPVQLAGLVAVRLVRPGDRVDLFALDSPGSAPAPVAQDALVLAVTGTDDTDGGLLVALRPDGARRARNTPHRTGFDVVLRPR